MTDEAIGGPAPFDVEDARVVSHILPNTIRLPKGKPVMQSNQRGVMVYRPQQARGVMVHRPQRARGVMIHRP